MTIINDFIAQYLPPVLYTALTALAGYIGVMVKNLYTKYINDKTKADVAKTVVRAVEQVYRDLHGNEKLAKAIDSAEEMLSEKGIIITDLELRMLIESAVAEFNDSFKKTAPADGADAPTE